MAYMTVNILLISYYFSPDNRVGARRFSYLSEYLYRKGLNPHVLTIKEKYINQKDSSINSNGIVHRTSLFPSFPLSRFQKVNRAYEILFGQIDNNIGWFLPGIISGFKIIKKYKINTVVVTGPPFSSFLIPYALSFFLKFKLIIDYRDPWTVDDHNGGISRFEKEYNNFFEKLILKEAEKIIFNTLRTKEAYLALNLKFKIEEKSFVINNSYFFENNILPKFLEKDKKVIIYGGNFYGNRRLKYIFEPLIKLFGTEEIKNKISLHIFGKIHDEDIELLKTLNLTEIIVEHKKVDYSLLMQYMKGSDILYLSQGEDHRYSIPYKLIDYLTIKKPILAVTSINSSTYNFMKGLDSGIVADIDDPNSIYLALKELLIDGRKFSFKGIEKYSIENTGKEYYRIISS